MSPDNVGLRLVGLPVELDGGESNDDPREEKMDFGRSMGVGCCAPGGTTPELACWFLLTS